MGSYAFIDCSGKFVAGANRKFFGYIEDEECEQTRSYQFLKHIIDNDVDLVNISYIGVVGTLTYHQLIIFMRLYAMDFFGLDNDDPHDEEVHIMWDTIKWPPNREIKQYELGFC